MPIWNKISFQNRNSPLIEHLSFFHDHRIILIIIVTIIVISLLKTAYFTSSINRFFLESNQTELFWTSLPAIILIFIAIPSLKTLYTIEETFNPLLSIKTIGYQWYWSYEYPNLKNKSINALIYPSKKIRLESTSNSLVIPSLTLTKIIISSKDVIHSWTIPSLGIKTDATPGRINQIIIIIKHPRIIVGQCSEICGAGHRFIPIFLESPSPKNFTLML